ncbi:hypothetical protein Tco_1064797, partial [Tanacetum coccineum]
MPGPEHPPSPVYVPYVSKPAYPEFMPPEDDVFLAEERPLPVVVLLAVDSPGYITEFDPEEDSKEEDPADFRSLADSVPPPVYCITARMSIQAQTPIPFPSEAEVDRLLAIPTPPPSPLTSYSSPLPHIPSPPLPVSSPLPVSPLPLPTSPTHPLSYRAAIIWLRAKSPSASHLLPLPLPIDTDEVYGRLDDAQDDRLAQLATRWMLVIRYALRLRWQDYRVSRDQLGIQHILMYRRRPVVVLRSGYVLAILYSLLSITGNSWLKMAPKKRTTRSSPATTTTTTPVTNAQLKALIDQGIADALAARDADRSRNGDDSHNSGTVGQDATHSMPWNTLMKMMTAKYCPRNEIKKLEMEIWELKCERMFPEESGKIKKYIGGLLDMIHKSVMASKPKTMQDAVEFAIELMDKKIL